MLAGNATDVVLDPNSGSPRPDTGTDVGNLQIVYAGHPRAQGVFISTNQGQSWNLMTGGVGNPLIVDTTTAERQPGHQPDPQRRRGTDRPGQARPDRQRRRRTRSTRAGSTPPSRPPRRFDGLFVTKDFGENWTQVGIATTLAPVVSDAARPARPMPLQPGHPQQRHHSPVPDHRLNRGTGSHLTIDPTNPNIIYLGGFGGEVSQ